MQTSIIFLTAMSKDIGIGHFSRVCKIAAACSDQLSTRSTLWLISGKVENSKYFRSIVHDEKIGNILQKNNLPEFIVFDLHFSFIDEKFKQNLEKFNKAGIKTIGIDCSINLSSLVEIVWIPSFFIKQESSSYIPSNVIYGWDTYFNYQKNNHEKWQHGDNVLVLTGGSDVAKQGMVLPKLFEQTIKHPLFIDWVQGPYSEDPLIPNDSKHMWRIHKAPLGISHLIEKANYAVSLYGVSLFELLSCGVPTAVYSPYSDRDDNELKELSAENICLVSKDASHALISLSEIMMNHDQAIEMSERSLSKLRTSGIERFVKLLYAMKRSNNYES